MGFPTGGEAGHLGQGPKCPNSDSWGTVPCPKVGHGVLIWGRTWGMPQEQKMLKILGRPIFKSAVKPYMIDFLNVRL